MMKRSLSILTIFTLFLATTPSWAADPMKIVDPCIQAREDFAENRQRAMALVDELIAKERNISDDAAMEIWLNNAREDLKEFFTKDILPEKVRIIELSGGTADPELLFADWIANEVLKDQELRAAVVSQYRAALDQQLAEERANVVAKFDKNKSELNDNCSMAFGDQVLRAGMTVAVSPVNILIGNLKAGEDESGFGAKVLRGTLGISANDMVKHGLLGGPNSEAKALAEGAEKAVQDIGKTAEKAAQDTGKTLEKAAKNLGKAVGIKL